jgi:hypothetical protein
VTTYLQAHAMSESDSHILMDLQVRNIPPGHGPILAITYLSCGVPGTTPALATRDMRTSQTRYVERIPGGWRIPEFRPRNEPASDSQFGTALIVSAIVMALILAAIT